MLFIPDYHIFYITDSGGGSWTRIVELAVVSVLKDTDHRIIYVLDNACMIAEDLWSMIIQLWAWGWP